MPRHPLFIFSLSLSPRAPLSVLVRCTGRAKGVPANPFIPRIRFWRAIRSLFLSASLSPLWLAARPVISTSINVGENSSLSLLHTVDASLFFFFLFFVTFSSRKDSAGDGDREIEESRGGRESAENKATAVDIWSSYTWSRNFRLIIFIWFLDGVRHTVGVKREKERGEERGGGGSGFGGGGGWSTVVETRERERFRGRTPGHPY